MTFTEEKGMDRDVTKLALECLKIDLERLRLTAEANKLMMEAFNALIPIITQVIAALAESGGELTPETLKDLGKRIPGFVVKLPTLNDFIIFAKTIPDEALESLIADLQKMLDEREK